MRVGMGKMGPASNAAMTAGRDIATDRVADGRYRAPSHDAGTASAELVRTQVRAPSARPEEARPCDGQRYDWPDQPIIAGFTPIVCSARSSLLMPCSDRSVLRRLRPSLLRRTALLYCFPDTPAGLALLNCC